MTTKLLNERLQTFPVLYDAATATLDRRHIGNLDTLIESVRSCSPYLKQLCDRWQCLTERLISESPEDIAAELIQNAKTLEGYGVAENCTESITEFQYDEICLQLRHLKQKIHLLCALCDVSKIWNWENIGAILSDFCDTAMHVLVDGLAQEHGFIANDVCRTPGFFILALGKYGGRELNYSSDIDFIIFYDPETVSLKNPDKSERLLLRFVRKLVHGFDSYTDGYIFRTDLRLRPDPRSNSTVISTRTAERYYETLGQNWERAAMIKARFCGGDKKAAQSFIDQVLSPFIWRRSLDYAAIEDIHSIKRQIQGEADLSSLEIQGHDLKLGLGGIREIEFYTQVQQLILGGRNKQIRTPRTIDALSALSKGGYVDPIEAETMIADYGFLRDCEHRIQMYKDEQNHKWPIDIETRQKIVGLSGEHNVEKFEAKLVETCTRIHLGYTNLFPREESLASPLGSLVFTGVVIEPQTERTLEELGFKRSEMVWGRVSKWLGGRIKATRTPRARELLTKLTPRFIELCSGTGQADDAFIGLSQFIEQLNSGVEVFSLLINKPKALELLIEIIAITPIYAERLSQQIELIAVMCEPDFLERSIDMSRKMYVEPLQEQDDFELNLNLLRACVHEDQFKTVMSAIRGQEAGKTSYQLSVIAEAAITSILPVCQKEIERLYGDVSGEYAVVAFGKLGSMEMNIRSDLDIILVYKTKQKFSPSEGILDQRVPTGEKEGQELFNKLTRRLITALSSVTSSGGLYEVDMTLRPSGRSGPLAVSLQAFERYYRRSAWTWEFMALSRARIVAPSNIEFKNELENAINQVMLDKNFHGDLENDIVHMHERILQEKPCSNVWDVKMVTGGIRYIDFIAQYLLLKNKNHFKTESRPVSTQQILIQAQKLNWMETVDAQQLLSALLFYQSLSQIAAIVTQYSSDGIVDVQNLSQSKKNAILQALNIDQFQHVESQFAAWRQRCDEIFSKILYAKT